jgi:hypothetical protein
MAKRNSGSAMVRAAEAIRITGWPRGYFWKLVAVGVVKQFKPTPHCRAMYYRTQLEELSGGTRGADEGRGARDEAE